MAINLVLSKKRSEEALETSKRILDYLKEHNLLLQKEKIKSGVLQNDKEKKETRED